jgi:hypothetical protein
MEVCYPGTLLAEVSIEQLVADDIAMQKAGIPGF